MKVAIIAACSGYGIGQVVAWTESLKLTGYSGKVGILLYEENEELATYFREQGFEIFYTEKREVTHMATQRFQDYTRMLLAPYFNDVTHVIHTDIRDVLFQLDPSPIFERLKDGKRIIATAEGVKFRNEDWNGEGMQKNFGKAVYSSLAEKQTLCSGVIAGEKEALITLFNTVFELAFYSDDPGGFADQHFYNLAIYKIYEKWTEIVPADEPWVANLATLIAIPMQQPNWSSGPRTPNFSYERIRKGNFIDNMQVDMPRMIAGKIFTPKKELYPIIHQYDRYEPWKKEIFKLPEETKVINIHTPIPVESPTE